MQMSKKNARTVLEAKIHFQGLAAVSRGCHPVSHLIWLAAVTLQSQCELQKVGGWGIQLKKIK